jgi:hypothetical protein
MSRFLPIVLLILTKSSAEELFVFSELSLLTLPQPSAPDCGFAPRAAPFTSLSPAIPAGGTLRLIALVSHLPGKPFVFSVGLNPPSALHIQVRRIFPAWDPPHDPVTVPLPLRARIPESQSCALFLIEAAAPPSLSPTRVKLEPALWLPDSGLSDFWIRYPMEVRILPPAPLAHPPAPCPSTGAFWQDLLIASWAAETGECLPFSSLQPQLPAWLARRRNQARAQ